MLQLKNASVEFNLSFLLLSTSLQPRSLITMMDVYPFLAMHIQCLFMKLSNVEQHVEPCPGINGSNVLSFLYG